jgi:hypothetical protein
MHPACCKVRRQASVVSVQRRLIEECPWLPGCGTSRGSKLSQTHPPVVGRIPTYLFVLPNFLSVLLREGGASGQALPASVDKIRLGPSLASLDPSTLDLEYKYLAPPSSFPILFFSFSNSSQLTSQDFSIPIPRIFLASGSSIIQPFHCSFSSNHIVKSTLVVLT